MKVDERVRQALHADAKRLEVPARPSLDELAGVRGAGRWRVAVAAGAVAAAVLIVAAAVAGLVPGRVPVPEIGPVDQPGTGPDPQPQVSFDPADGEVFATGEVDGIGWTAAAGLERTPDGQTAGLCVGIRYVGLPGGDGQDVRCTSRLLDAGSGIEVVELSQIEEVGLVAVAGVAAAEADRIVWDLGGRTVEVELHDHPQVEQRVFAAVAAHDGASRLAAYTADGTRLMTRLVAAPAGDDQRPAVGYPLVLEMGAAEPFPWAVGVASDGDDGWCVASTVGARELPEADDRSCAAVDTPRRGFGAVGGVEQGPDGGVLMWGTVQADHEVVVVLADGTTEPASTAAGGQVPFTVWAYAYTDPVPVAIEARVDGEVVDERRLGPGAS